MSALAARPEGQRCGRRLARLQAPRRQRGANSFQCCWHGHPGLALGQVPVTGASMRTAVSPAATTTGITVRLGALRRQGREAVHTAPSGLGPFCCRFGDGAGLGAQRLALQRGGQVGQRTLAPGHPR
jgi:hypothetical protein